MQPLKGDPGAARRGRRARWGWLFTTLALGLALVGSAWANYRSVRNASDSLIRGQAQILESAVRSGAFRAWERQHDGRRHGGRGGEEGARAEPDSTRRDLGRPPGSPSGEGASAAAIQAVLDSTLAERRESGLRFAGILSPAGEMIAASGTPVGVAFALPEPQEGPVVGRVDDRVRAYFVGSPGGPGADRPVLVLEFEPVVAEEMVARASRTLAVSAVGAAILMLAALVFWRLSQRFEEAERRLEEQRRLSELGEMSAVLAHEIRNPLASLKGHGQLLLEQLPGDSPVRRKAERVVTEASRLEALTSDLLDFARSAPLQLRPTDPVALARASVEEAAPGDGVVVHGGAAPPTWPLDELRLRQVLVNLLRNAVQASPAGFPAEVTVAEDRGRLSISVEDRGEGLAPGEEARVFDPFYTTRTTGTGLGLPVARRIVEMHGGTIIASNRHGGGATFRIEIPGIG